MEAGYQGAQGGNSGMNEIMEKMSAVINIQQNVIEELFRLLLQHISADEADRLPVVEKINHAAEIRAEIGGLHE